MKQKPNQNTLRQSDNSKYYDLDRYSLKVKVILIKMEIKFTETFLIWGI